MKHYLMIALRGAFEGAIYELHDALEDEWKEENRKAERVEARRHQIFLRPDKDSFPHDFMMHPR